MKLKRIAAMLTAAVMAVSLAACGGNTGTNTESSQNPQENAEAQAVHLNLAESWGFEYFYTIITPEVSSSSGYDITYYLTSFYDTLFEYNSEGEVVGVLAEDWSMSEDGKTYTFQIKHGVKFSDGSDLTAEDVAKSILAVPVNLGQYNGSYGRLSTIIEDAVATDEYTVELHLTQPYYNTLRELCLVAVMLVGGILVTAGSLSIPMFILFLLFAGRIYDPFTSCFMLMAEVFSALVSVKRMKQIDATPEQTGTNVCNNKGYDIEFKNVVFSYNEEPVLKGVSFVAKQGEVTALVGPSGSGKSTASKLAARFWDADSGTITLGGVDVKTVEPETLFKNYAIVFQDVMLFDETVMENIRLGRGDATDEEVMAAARAAQCEEFIQRLPQGYQTNIGENGSALSGGERQRISIARALLKNAPIVLLDEATASMDAESETLVQDALSVLLKDKTVMVIAHRMRTVANADKIVVLDDGKVSEMGTPAELMAKGGLYSHLVALQQGR